MRRFAGMAIVAAIGLALAGPAGALFDRGSDCLDGIDNDGDGLVDWPNDPGCDDRKDATEYCDPGHAGWGCPECDNGIDDDGDGLVDWPNDPGCPDPEADLEDPVCDDYEDNDGDGAIDYPDDPGCDAYFDSEETSAALVCDNGFDDDGDGEADYPDDPGCLNLLDPTEKCVAGVDPDCPECDDEIDDECVNGSPFPCDGKVDYPEDPGCQFFGPWGTELGDCHDGVDNDGDGTIDYGRGPWGSGTPLWGVSDSGCQGWREEWREDPECDDLVDNDGDGYVDKRGGDPECHHATWISESKPKPVSAGCGIGWELALLIPALWLCRGLRKRQLFVVSLALIAFGIGLASKAEARTLSNAGVLMAHCVNDTATAVMAPVDEWQRPSWLGYEPPRWVHWTPAFPIASALRMASRLPRGLYCLVSVPVEIATYRKVDGVGSARPLDPDPRWRFVKRSTLRPLCSWPWAREAPECLLR